MNQIKIPTIPRSMANQTITFCKQSNKTDKYGKTLPSEQIQINNVVVQEDPVYSGTNNNREIQANAVIFVYADISDPIPAITQKDLGSKVIFESTEYTLKRVVTNRNPFNDELWGYELEVQ